MKNSGTDEIGKNGFQIIIVFVTVLYISEYIIKTELTQNGLDEEITAVE